MNPLQPILDQQGFVMLDGALATELERRGADLNHKLWSARMLQEDPASIEALHYDYLCAGADVIITASYQATPQGMAAVGFPADQAGDLIQLSVKLALDARQRWAAADRARPLVAASIGPYATYLADGSEYTGDYDLDHQELKDFHRPRMALLDETQADLFALETVPSRLEAEALLDLLAEFPRRKAWLAFSCKDERHVCHGESFADCVALVRGNDQIVAVGVNCSAPHIVQGLLQSVPQGEKALIVYPNSGEHYHSGDNSWSPADVNEQSLPDQAVQWLEAGASLIGGCCRTTVEEIAAMKQKLLASGHGNAQRTIVE